MLKFPITRRVAVAGAMVLNRWWAEKLQDQAEQLEMIPPVVEEEYPAGCYI